MGFGVPPRFGVISVDFGVPPGAVFGALGGGLDPRRPQRHHRHPPGGHAVRFGVKTPIFGSPPLFRVLPPLLGSPPLGSPPLLGSQFGDPLPVGVTPPRFGVKTPIFGVTPTFGVPTPILGDPNIEDPNFGGV